MSDPSKYDLASYVATIDSVMTALDKIAVVQRPAWMGAEFERSLEAWRQAVEKENEERQHQEGAGRPSDQSGGSG